MLNLPETLNACSVNNGALVWCKIPDHGGISRWWPGVVCENYEEWSEQDFQVKRNWIRRGFSEFHVLVLDNSEVDRGDRKCIVTGDINWILNLVWLCIGDLVLV